MSFDDRLHRRDVPSPIDLAGHLRDLAGAVVPALIIAFLVGAAVFGLRTAFASNQFAATIITQIFPGGEVVRGDTSFEQARAPLTGLAHDTKVLAEGF